MDVYILPMIISSLNAIIWTSIVHTTMWKDEDLIDQSVEKTYSLLLTTTLGFLLVFRLNRGAVRWWDTRSMWGIIVEETRNLATSILEYTSHDPKNRDMAISWLMGFLISSKQFIRGENYIPEDEVAGFLNNDQIASMNQSNHPAIYAASEIRHSLELALHVTAHTPAGLGAAQSSQMRHMERSIQRLLAQTGGMERVKSTPLPIVYVSHLRSFLFLYLLSLPYLYAKDWGWYTIPTTCLFSFALLGIDGAATECERPFNKNRPNHLDMEAYCITAMENIQQLFLHYMDMHCFRQS
mmetsp:Transcript_17289/g.24423  ORF Transcript_17289/g.24423 Transcript_17289/m.24423 type:complete len:296 (+) Transcript_17289:129-1016(+)